MGERPYRLRKRAEQQEQTRERILRATLALHEEVGPAATTISAIAERAGVQRLTVYRHFPDESALFAACSRHAAAADPPPDPGGWAGVSDPGERLRLALEALYAYYRRGERMLTHVLRDAEQLSPLAEALAPMRAYLEAVVELLAFGRGDAGGDRLVRAALAHAVQFGTWRSLAAQGLDDVEITRLMRHFVAAAGGIPHGEEEA